MAQRAAERLMTFEDVAKLDPDEFHGELDQGRWVPVTRSTWRHGQLAVKIAILLDRYARTSGAWSVAVGDIGTKLRKNPDTLRCPDVAVVRKERVPTGKGVAGWLEGAPELAVEIAGDSQTMTELTRKALEYLAAGGKMVWVVDPESERVMVFTPPDHVRVLGKEDALDGGDALPGFRCQVAELFE